MAAASVSRSWYICNLNIDLSEETLSLSLPALIAAKPSIPKTMPMMAPVLSLDMQDFCVLYGRTV